MPSHIVDVVSHNPEVIAWVLGEYARLATIDGYTIEDIADLLTECIERPSASLAFDLSAKKCKRLYGNHMPSKTQPRPV